MALQMCLGEIVRECFKGCTVHNCTRCTRECCVKIEDFKLDDCKRCCEGCGETLSGQLLKGCQCLGNLPGVCCNCIQKCSYVGCRECSRDSCGYCDNLDRCCCCCCDIWCPAPGFVFIMDSRVMSGTVNNSDRSGGRVVVVQQPQPVMAFQVVPAPQQQFMEAERLENQYPHPPYRTPPHHHHRHQQPHAVHIHPASQGEYQQPLRASPPGGPPEGEIATMTSTTATTVGTTATIASDATTFA